MKELILLYWGCVFLMYLSQVYYPAPCRLNTFGGRLFMWEHMNVFMFIVIIWMALFSALRTSYNDTGAYVDGFNAAESISEGFLNGTFTDWANDAWSQLYASIVRSITDNYHIYFFFPALMCSLSAVKFFRSYSVNPAFSLLIYFSVGTYITYIAALKQCIAMFFLLWALPLLADRKVVQYYILVAIAIMFHTYSAVFLLLPFLSFKPWGKITWTMVGLAVLMVMQYDTIMHFIVDTAHSVGLDMKEDEIFYDHGLSPIRVAVYLLPGILALFFRRRLFYNSTKSENLMVNMSILSGLILMIGTVKGANLYGRMAAYFEISTAVAVPWIIAKLFTEQSARIVTTMASVLYFGYFLFEFAITKDFGNEYAAISLWDFLVSLF